MAASMKRACLVAVTVVLTLLLMEGAAAGTAGIRSMEQRRQVESLLRRLNKPPVASFESPDGDIIDCVDIFKQPAFDHPLLKNHIIQMRPSYQPRDMYHDSSNIAHRPITQSWHQIVECPENTVPILRTREEDVLRASSISRYGKKRPRSMPYLVSMDDPVQAVTDGHQYGVASARGDSNYYGTKGTFNKWQPKIGRAGDFSLAQLWITSGSYASNDLNTIEVGWQVYPQMNGNNSTRLFIYWTRDAYRSTGCYNLKCSGFVQTNRQIVIGGNLSPVSIYGGPQYEIDILVWKVVLYNKFDGWLVVVGVLENLSLNKASKECYELPPGNIANLADVDPGTHNWWLKVGTSLVGYWPSSIFTHLANSATTVQWGGEIASQPGAGQTSTHMGSGHFPEEGFNKASYIRNIQVVDSSNRLKSPGGVGLIAPQPNCYNVKNGVSSNWGTYIFFGGPGKNPKCLGMSFTQEEYLSEI